MKPLTTVDNVDKYHMVIERQISFQHIALSTQVADLNNRIRQTKGEWIPKITESIVQTTALSWDFHFFNIY